MEHEINLEAVEKHYTEFNRNFNESRIKPKQKSSLFTILFLIGVLLIIAGLLLPRI